MQILVDLHTHTVSSGHAYSTLTENAFAASRRGLKLIGMTDHAPSMPGAPHLYHFGNLSVIPHELFGVRIVPGVEANITTYEGELDVPLHYLEKMPIVLAGLHTICYPGGTVDQNTEAYIKAMSNPFVDIMVHPGRQDFELDIEKVAFSSSHLNVAVEINNTSLSLNLPKNWDNCKQFAKYAAKYKSTVALGSDAHFWDKVGQLDLALSLVKESGIEEENILNLDPQKVLSYLENRRKSR